MNRDLVALVAAFLLLSTFVIVIVISLCGCHWRRQYALEPGPFTVFCAGRLRPILPREPALMSSNTTVSWAFHCGPDLRGLVHGQRKLHHTYWRKFRNTFVDDAFVGEEENLGLTFMLDNVCDAMEVFTPSPSSCIYP